MIGKGRFLVRAMRRHGAAASQIPHQDIARSLRTKAVGKMPPAQGGDISRSQALRYMEDSLLSDGEPLEKTLSITAVGKGLNLMQTDNSVPDLGLYRIKEQQYRVFLRGENIIPHISSPETKEGVFELSQDTSTTTDPKVANAFRRYVHPSTMRGLKNDFFQDKLELRHCLDDARSKLAVIFVPVGVPLMTVPDEFCDNLNMDREAEVILPKGALVEVTKECPVGSGVSDSLRAQLAESHHDKFELYYVRYLTEKEEVEQRRLAT